MPDPEEQVSEERLAQMLRSAQKGTIFQIVYTARSFEELILFLKEARDSELLPSDKKLAVSEYLETLEESKNEEREITQWPLENHLNDNQEISRKILEVRRKSRTYDQPQAPLFARRKKQTIQTATQTC